MAIVVPQSPFGRISRGSLGGNLLLPSAANKALLSSTRYTPYRPPNKWTQLGQEQASSFPPDSCEPCRRSLRNYFAPNRNRRESDSSTLSKQETTWCTPHSQDQLQLVSKFNRTLPQHNGAICLDRTVVRFHDLGPSSDGYPRFALFDQVIFLQVTEKLPHIVLSMIPANAELPADFIDNR